jgi:pyridoxamine 5'-phosphate oxidase
MLAPWRSPIARALHRNRALPYARYLQLATVRSNGRPANRTIVFRGFLENSNQLKFITDARSEKATQIQLLANQHSAWGEACWYFPKTREQFRLSGSLILVDETTADPILQSARQLAWQELSDAARTQFTWAHPGEPRNQNSFPSVPPSPQTPLSHFCLLLLSPVEVDHLELRGEPQNRWIYRLDGIDWSMKAVNP